MGCVETRLDAADLNTTSAQTVTEFVYPGTGTRVYAAWASSAGSGIANRLVYSNYFDWSDHSVGTPVQIQTDNTQSTDNIASVMLDNGTWIVAYGRAGARVKEAVSPFTDWTSFADVGATSWGQVGETRTVVALAKSGNTAWLFMQRTGGGTGSGDLVVYKRTGALTWTGPTTIYDAAGISTGPVPFTTYASQGGVHACVMKDATTGLLVLDFVPSGTVGPDTITQVVAFPTTDGWASAVAPVVIKTYAAGHNHTPTVLVGTDERARCSWSDNTVAVGLNMPYLAYSDDWGKTWTLIGSPVAFQAATGLFSWDPTFDRASWLGQQNTWFLGTFDNTVGVKHHLFSGGDALTGWVDDVCTGLPYGTATQSSGDGFIQSHQWFRLFTRINVATYNVDILWKENVDTTPGGPPPLVAESPTGIDLPNTYLRLDIADGKGWSAHDLQVSCMFTWPEGDYTTERRKDEILACAASVDPTVQNPAYLPALYKIDDGQRWSKEAFVDDGTGNLALIEEPFRFRWHSATMNFGETGSTNLFRAAYLQFRREGIDTFNVEVWIDEVLVHTETIKPHWPDPEEFWWPLPRNQNAGCRVQLRIEDNVPADLIIETFAIKFRPKHWRMRIPV